MSWPFRYKQHPSDRIGIEKVKLAQSVADQINEHATEAEAEHRDILRRNNLKSKFERALGGN